MKVAAITRQWNKTLEKGFKRSAKQAAVLQKLQRRVFGIGKRYLAFWGANATEVACSTLCVAAESEDT